MFSLHKLLEKRWRYKTKYLRRLKNESYKENDVIRSTLLRINDGWLYSGQVLAHHLLFLRDDHCLHLYLRLDLLTLHLLLLRFLLVHQHLLQFSIGSFVLG